jgi:hypothetical protein
MSLEQRRRWQRRRQGGSGSGTVGEPHLVAELEPPAFIESPTLEDGKAP